MSFSGLPTLSSRQVSRLSFKAFRRRHCLPLPRSTRSPHFTHRPVESVPFLAPHSHSANGLSGRCDGLATVSNLTTPAPRGWQLCSVQSVSTIRLPPMDSRTLDGNGKYRLFERARFTINVSFRHGVSADEEIKAFRFWYGMWRHVVNIANCIRGRNQRLGANRSQRG